MKLNIINTIGDDEIAKVYIAKTAANKYLEFAESIQPPLSRKEKWVLIVSVLYGCPVGCMMCDAGSAFYGKLSKEDIFAQIDYLVDLRYPDKFIDCKEFKIQFARMGEPALNPFLLDVLEELPERYRCGDLLPSISTVAPNGCDYFFSRLTTVKNRLYPSGKFQMQFSIHTTDKVLRDQIIPVNKWDFVKIANYCEEFYSPGDRKITLNFALAQEAPVDVKELRKYFSPDLFIIKITPINPTVSAINNRITSYFVTGDSREDTACLIDRLRDAGYEVILSIGDLEENQIGSNCGQYIQKFITNKDAIAKEKAYSYVVKEKHSYP